RRVLIAAWGKEASSYVGRTLTLYGDPTIKFGKDEIGGIRIRAMSHITEPLTVALTVTRGKRAPFTVQPIPTDTGALTAAINDLTGAESPPALNPAWNRASRRGVQGHPDVIAAKDTRKAALSEGEDS